jgi:hypothetical protein
LWISCEWKSSRKMSKIQVIVDDILNGVGGYEDKKEVYAKKYPKFLKKFPLLFDKCCEDDCDTVRVRSMLSLLEDVETSRMSQHEASVAVGQDLYNAYIQPVLNEKK